MFTCGVFLACRYIFILSMAEMDANILKNIINSCSQESALTQDVKFPITTVDVIDKLSKTFTRILSYKVSQEVHQRYSETLRDWSRVKGEMGQLPAFHDAEQSCKFLINLLRKYSTPEVLSNCDDVDNLVRVAEILLNFIGTKKLLMKCFVRVIERIISLEQTEGSRQFLQHIVDKRDELKLDSSLVESIYVSQKSWLIEKPITDCFVAYCSDKSKQDQLDNLNCLFERIIDGPILFELVTNQLKDLFVQTEYSKDAQVFIQKVLEKIEACCSKYNKDTLDLYPPSLQFCVILLRIQPAHHTEKSKKHTVESLKDIFLKDHNKVLILVSHFPEWLPEYLKFFEEDFELTQETETQSTFEQIDSLQ